jgi:hypothetical protein
MSGEFLPALLTVFGGQLVMQCPVFLALIVGAVVGIVAFTRQNRLAGALAFGGFAALIVLLSFQLMSNAFLSLLPTWMIATQGRRPQDIIGLVGSLSVGAGCVFSVLKTLGLLAVIGALAACVFRKNAL